MRANPQRIGPTAAVRALTGALALALLSAGPPPPRPNTALRPSPTAGQREKLKAAVARVKKLVADDYERLEKLYKQLHANPELSFQELRTAARMTKEMRDLGFTVTQKVGGTGVVAVFRNGKGPTVLVRTEMDALPVVEKTGLPYASKVRTRDANDREVGVMHACGHDVHMTCWVGAAKVLVALKDQWKGTLLFVAQPAEEIGQGAKRMLADGLYQRFGKPDYCLALHCDSQLAHGTITSREGPALANVDSVDVILKGKGGHGAHPHTTIDPVVMAARLVLDLQTLVSREIKPTDPAVVTVGSIHGGTKHNIIPDEVTIQLTIRSTNDKVRKHLLDGIKRKAEAVAKGAGAAPPVVKIDLKEYTPALSNDVPLTRKMLTLFRDALGEAQVLDRPLVMGGEDLSRFGQGGVPLFIYWIGTAPPERVAAVAKEGAKALPSLHSDQYYPVVEPSVKTGVLTLSLAVMKLLGE